MTLDIGIGAALGLAAYLWASGALPEALPVLLLLAVIAAALYAGGVGGFSTPLRGEPGARVSTGVSFDDVGGQGPAKRELQEALAFVREPVRARRLGIRPLRGILLTGPPGTGKTLLAKAAATHTGSAFLAASGGEFVEVYAGVGARRVRGVFARARRLARRAGGNAVIFIDEIEVLGGRRGRHAGHLEYDQTLNQLLVQMDGLAEAGDETLVVIAATNRADLLDEALLRPGRFDRLVRVDPPDRQARGEILALHARDRPLAPDVNLDRLARETFGLSGAHLESLVNEAAILAWRQADGTIRRRHFVEALDKVLLGERAERRPTRAERRRIAVHEAGHALAAELLRPGSVASVTTVSRGGALGYVRRRPEADEHLITRERLEADAQIALAGHAAEELVLGGASTGAADDLRQLRDIVERMITAGMSPLGVTDPERVPVERAYRVRADLVRDLQRRVLALLRAHLPVLDALARRLLERESLDGADIRRALARPAPDAAAAGAAARGGEAALP